ncbi:hypothetical protein [Paenibacillus sp. FSL R7-0337]|uniref:hypothetical protein n=1 Tax=Paenibacillus sp. FSL R7-0337 TaxID=1926588 RepID=UPI0015C2DB6F|nr:hypothetical protein [Paenibacillus sp. FSL R7-0337]
MIIQVAIGILLMPFLFVGLRAIVHSKWCDNLARQQDKQFTYYISQEYDDGKEGGD